MILVISFSRPEAKLSYKMIGEGVESRKLNVRKTVKSKASYSNGIGTADCLSVVRFGLVGMVRVDSSQRPRMQRHVGKT